MQCSQCGMELDPPTRFCGYCGADQRPAMSGQARSTSAVVDVSSPPYLTMVVGPEVNRQFPLVGTMYFGRDTENDVLVGDPRVPRRHARIRVEGTRAIIADVGSTNGTFVNEVPVTGEQVLYDGDLIRMGRTEWRFHAPAQTGTGARRPLPPINDAVPRSTFRHSLPPDGPGIVERDELPWSAIAIVVGGLFIALTVCCIAAVFIASR